MQHKHKKINNFTNITYQENYNHQSKTNIKASTTRKYPEARLQKHTSHQN